MKVHVLSENIKKRLPFVHHAISSRSQLPVLLNFLLIAQNGQLSISATDLEIGIETKIQANIEEEGGVTVPAKLFLELISSLPLGKVTLELVGESLAIHTKKSKSILQTIAKEEFPKLYETIGAKLFDVGKEDLQNDFSKVVFAASSDIGNRPALSGILLKIDKEGFLYVATDGYRLSLKEQKIKKTKQEEEETLLIPARVIKEALFLKQEGDGDSVAIFIAKQNNQIIFQHQDTLLIGRLIEAEFPNFERIIPASSTYKATFTSDEMQKAVKACAIFARETSNIIKLQLRKDSIIVSANTPSLGENTVEVAAKAASDAGEESEIAFNARYLADLFANCDAEEMTLETTSPLHPGVFRIVGDDSFLHLIMPIRVQV